jgi:type IV secretory pathway VirB10-like protein
LAYFGACDGRFSDEQVFDVLREGDEGGQSVTDLCAAHGITVPMYCVWRQKYRHLPLEHLRDVRRRAARRARLRLAGVVMAVVGLVVVGPGVLLVSGRHTPPVPDAPAPVARREPTRTLQTAAPLPASAAPPAAPAAPPAAPAAPERPAQPEPEQVRDPEPEPSPVPARPAARAVVTSDPPSSSGRFAVQVAAAQSRAEADALVRRLAEAGHEAFVVPVTVGTVEHFRVRVGPFDSEDAAGERARALTRNGFPGAWVSR